MANLLLSGPAGAGKSALRHGGCWQHGQSRRPSSPTSNRSTSRSAACNADRTADTLTSGAGGGLLPLVETMRQALIRIAIERGVGVIATNSDGRPERRQYLLKLLGPGAVERVVEPPGKTPQSRDTTRRQSVSLTRGQGACRKPAERRCSAGTESHDHQLRGGAGRRCEPDRTGSRHRRAHAGGLQGQRPAAHLRCWLPDDGRIPKGVILNRQHSAGFTPSLGWSPCAWVTRFGSMQRSPIHRRAVPPRPTSPPGCSPGSERRSDGQQDRLRQGRPPHRQGRHLDRRRPGGRRQRIRPAAGSRSRRRMRRGRGAEDLVVITITEKPSLGSSSHRCADSASRNRSASSRRCTRAAIGWPRQRSGTRSPRPSPPASR